MKPSKNILPGAALVLLLFSPAYAHDFWINHSGYKSTVDGSHCCGNNDCFVVPSSEMQSTPTGWVIKTTGETIPYSEAQSSEDGEFWRCKKYDGTRRCFFAPQPSS